MAIREVKQSKTDWLFEAIDAAKCNDQYDRSGAPLFNSNFQPPAQ